MKATLTKTKAGNGFKIVFDKTWLYASKKNFEKFLNGESKSVSLYTIEESKEE